MPAPAAFVASSRGSIVVQRGKYRLLGSGCERSVLTKTVNLPLADKSVRVFTVAADDTEKISGYDQILWTAPSTTNTCEQPPGLIPPASR